MKIKLSIILLAALMAFSFNKANAQTGTPPSASSMKAAEEMLLAQGADVQYQKSFDVIIKQFSAQIPADKQEKFAGVMKAYLNKYASWDILKHDMFVMYAREFTEDELKQLTAFYKSPIGMKLNQKQPELLQTSMTLGQQNVMAHQAELQQLMADAMQ